MWWGHRSVSQDPNQRSSRPSLLYLGNPLAAEWVHSCNAQRIHDGKRARVLELQTSSPVPVQARLRICFSSGQPLMPPSNMKPPGTETRPSRGASDVHAPRCLWPNDHDHSFESLIGVHFHHSREGSGSAETTETRTPRGETNLHCSAAHGHLSVLTALWVENFGIYIGMLRPTLLVVEREPRRSASLSDEFSLLRESFTSAKICGVKSIAIPSVLLGHNVAAMRTADCRRRSYSTLVCCSS